MDLTSGSVIGMVTDMVKLRKLTWDLITIYPDHPRLLVASQCCKQMGYWDGGSF